MNLGAETQPESPAEEGWSDAGRLFRFATPLLLGLYAAGLYSYPLFHTLVEMFSVVISFGIFTIAWNTRRYSDNRYFLLIGIAYLFVGGIDLVHALAYKGMGVFRRNDSNLPTQLWISARSMESVSLFLAPFFLRRELRPRVAFAAYAGVFCLLLWSIFVSRTFPDCYVEGVGLTRFKVLAEYAICGILVGAAILLYKNREAFDSKVYGLVLASIAVTVLSEICFTKYVGVFDRMNEAGHFLKVVSFYLIYRALIRTGLVKPFALIFRDLKRSQEEFRRANDRLEIRVEERTQDLAKANTQLSGEILERRQAEDALRESESKYRSLFQYANEAIFIAQDEIIRFSNPATGRIMGYSSEELARVPFVHLVHPDDREMVAARHQRRLQEEELPVTYPVRIRNKAGEDLWIQLSSTRIDWEGKPAMLNFASDITPQKKLEYQLFRAQKMEAVGRLAGGIAHDFNNLLTAIIGYCDLSLMQPTLPVPLRRNIEEIRKASDRCASLTQQLLAFSRRQVLVPKVINLNDSVAGMGKILQRLIGEDIDLAFGREEDLWNIKADPAQIEQVIMNLAINARDAMPLGGKLTVEMQNVELEDAYASRHESVLPGPYVMLAVSDTGCGMDEKTQARIFEPFFTTKEKGTGLGLSTVYGIVKQHSGSIWVYSVPGAGTTFKAYFPRAYEKTTEQAFVAAEPLPEELRGSETVLLVEDEEMIRHLIREMLSRQGYQVLEASGGGDAIDLCSRFRGTIHLMLTDVVMPTMSGVELSKRLASRQPSMKVLFMSGYTGNAIVHQGILEPGIAFLQKPFTLGTLARKIRVVLGAGTPGDPPVTNSG